MNNNSTYAPDTQVLIVKGAARKKFLINGDPEKVLELNTTDLGILERVELYLPKLQEIESEVSKIKTIANTLVTKNKDTEEPELNFESVTEFNQKLNDCDKQMRKYINLIFDAKVSEVCDCGGTMYDPVDGQMRYASIISDLSAAYDNDLTAEIKKMNNRRNARTAKYTKKKKG